MTASSQTFFMKLLSKSFISQSTDFHFAKYRFPFRKVQIYTSQSTDLHFTKYRFISQSTDSFRKVQISFRFVSFRKPSVSVSVVSYVLYLQFCHRITEI